MSSRWILLFLFLLSVTLGLSGLITWQGSQYIRIALGNWVDDLFSVRRPISVTDLNQPPNIDPECISRLQALPGVQVRPAAEFERGQGCVFANGVFVDQLAGVPFRPQSPIMRCEVAEQLNTWLEEAVQPQATDLLSAEITEVGHLGTYSCRTIGGNSSVLSQHSFANAIDVAWFDLSDGRRIRLLEGWESTQEGISKFWQEIQQLSCKYFDVSLGPDYNAAHRDHFHFDLGPLNVCR